MPNNTTKSRSPRATLQQKVEALTQPQAYPEKPHRIDTVQTHMSWVFLTEHHAYKLKKPVRHEFLDFSTLEARYLDCREELRLNRRLATDVYLELVPLGVDAYGQIRLEVQDQIIDWLLKMRRLPAERMLDNLIRTAQVQEADIRRVAQTLSRFYNEAALVPMVPAEYLARFERDVWDSRQELSQPEYRLPLDRVVRTAAAQQRFLERDHRLLSTRVLEGKIIEAHGDLRPEHIYLGTAPKIIDCLEFKRAFRLLDPVDELAFLAMECEQLGAATIESVLFACYTEMTGDRPPAKLVRFYKSCRASLRAKLAVWHLKEPDVVMPAKWPEIAGRYLRLAEHYLQGFSD